MDTHCAAAATHNLTILQCCCCTGTNTVNAAAEGGGEEEEAQNELLLLHGCCNKPKKNKIQKTTTKRERKKGGKKKKRKKNTTITTTATKKKSHALQNAATKNGMVCNKERAKLLRSLWKKNKWWPATATNGFAIYVKEKEGSLGFRHRFGPWSGQDTRPTRPAPFPSLRVPPRQKRERGRERFRLSLGFVFLPNFDEDFFWALQDFFSRALQVLSTSYGIVNNPLLIIMLGNASKQSLLGQSSRPFHTQHK